MTASNELYDELAAKAKKIRREVINMIYMASSGHPGGALSIVDILTVLYFIEMKIDPLNPSNQNRDRLVLSKGHASAALYATLALRGFFSEEKLLEFRKLGSILQGHPDMKNIPGVDMSTGSLGQGLSCANGMAISSKLDKKDNRIYSILGDGELEEGQVWEALMTSSKYKLDNLCVIVDNNDLQIDGKIDEITSLYPIDEKFKNFGFNVINIDGHDFAQIINAFENARLEKNRPTVIIAKTIKGKGVSYMENEVGWHGKAPNEAELAKAMQDLL